MSVRSEYLAALRVERGFRLAAARDTADLDAEIARVEALCGATEPGAAFAPSLTAAPGSTIETTEAQPRPRPARTVRRKGKPTDA